MRLSLRSIRLIAPLALAFAVASPGDEKRIAANLAKIMAMLCVRNLQLATLRAGLSPVAQTGDYSVVFVADSGGRRIAWTDVSHIDEDKMRDTVNRLFKFHFCAQIFRLPASGFRLPAQIERWMGIASNG